ncbi:MAG: MBL fold metallo-hydrolase [Desulfobacterota bacterium]|nr:MBL fold metallo-hydrolase [Thermodesulfobacteriota bacterium]
MKIAEGLYAYIWQSLYENNCNTYLIETDKIALIDPGHLHRLPNLFDQMERDGVSPERIDLVIATHSHPDHLEGLEAFVERPVKIAMGLEEEGYLQGSGKHLYEMMGHPLPSLRIDFFLKEGEFFLGRERFFVYHTPGHSPGSLTLYWPAQKALFTGDLVFSGGVGRTDFPGGNGKELMRSIERMARLEIEWLLPGHGEVVQGKEWVLYNFQSIRQNFYPFL